jgi:hypothetical protein
MVPTDFILCREHNNRHRPAVGCAGTPIISLQDLFNINWVETVKMTPKAFISTWKTMVKSLGALMTWISRNQIGKPS